MLTRLVYPTAPIEEREQLVRDCFMDLLGDPDMGNFLRQIRIVLEYEAFTTGHRRKFSNRAPLRRQTRITRESEEEDEISCIVD